MVRGARAVIIDYQQTALKSTNTLMDLWTAWLSITRATYIERELKIQLESL